MQRTLYTTVRCDHHNLIIQFRKRKDLCSDDTVFTDCNDTVDEDNVVAMGVFRVRCKDGSLRFLDMHSFHI